MRVKAVLAALCAALFLVSQLAWASSHKERKKTDKKKDNREQVEYVIEQ